MIKASNDIDTSQKTTKTKNNTFDYIENAEPIVKYDFHMNAVNGNGKLLHSLNEKCA